MLPRGTMERMIQPVIERPITRNQTIHHDRIQIVRWVQACPMILPLRRYRRRRRPVQRLFQIVVAAVVRCPIPLRPAIRRICF
jgi:hypothetical protein